VDKLVERRRRKDGQEQKRFEKKIKKTIEYIYIGQH